MVMLNKGSLQKLSVKNIRNCPYVGWHPPPPNKENLQKNFTSLKWCLGNSKTFSFFPLKRPKNKKNSILVWWEGVGGHTGKNESV